MSWKRFGLLAALALSACSSKDEAPDRIEEGSAPAVPLECQGFPLDGLEYSPGGTALPNSCAPFNPLTNNPYAVRCVDAWPAYDTGYLGDEYCILPPDPEKGLQIGVHPQGSSYWDAVRAGDLSGYAESAVPADFELEPGGEREDAYLTRTTNDEERFYYRIDSRMRSGSHHLASYHTTLTDGDGWRGPVTTGVPDEADGGFFWNAQRSNADRPASSLDLPSEDLGIGMALPPRQGILFDVHHFNTLGESILREVWLNVWWVDGTVERPVIDRPLVAPVDVAPGEIKDLPGKFVATEKVRVLSLFGHRHAWTTRVHAWLKRADQTETVVYDSYDWLDVPTYSYDSVSTNPAPDPELRRDGASSGILTLDPGDELGFNCHVEATADRAAELGIDPLTEPLRFGNKAFGAEMCILYAQLTTAE